jgi:roadblock/LC7 domain-containing protein
VEVDGSSTGEEIFEMATLDELAKIDGVVAAGEFNLDGSLVDYRANMDMSRELAAQAAQFCATVSMLFRTLGGSFEQLSGMPWTPQQGWAYSGGQYTVAIGDGGTKGVFIETAKADFNQLFGALVGEH